MRFSVVAAVGRSFGIGKNGSIPWHLPGDLAFFKNLTAKTKDPSLQNAVIMGRTTWESIPDKYKPLSKRINVVLTTQLGPARTKIEEFNARVASSLPEAFKLLKSEEFQHKLESVFIIGGSSAYREGMSLPECEAVYLTHVDTDVECDTFFPRAPLAHFRTVSTSERHTEGDISYEFVKYERSDDNSANGINGAVADASSSSIPNGVNGVSSEQKSSQQHEEYQYLNMIRDILENGVAKGDRTGTGTLSKFGCTMRFSLRDNEFPLLTTKRVFWRGVAEELLWFISGKTNAKLLSDKGIRIWDGNGSREFLDQRGLAHREEGDLGPVYGFQWRHFGAKYVDMHTDYTGQGVDQLKQVIEKIKTNPNDRRILMSAWNPSALDEMALPPCHIMCQFYVANGELSCLMFQRSCDMGLGVPFNIASYALLTRLIAQVCNLKCGDFVHMLGDAHVYSNHVEPLREQLKREPRPFPTLAINPDVTDIDDFKYEDFTITGYKPHKKIAMKMAV